MKKLILSKREKHIGILTGFLFSAYMLYIAVYMPFQNKKVSLEAEILEARRQLMKNTEIISRSKLFEKQYKTILTDFNQSSVDEQIMADILSEIEAVNAEISVSISDKKPRKTKIGELYNQFSVNLTLEGTLAEIMRFIHMLQNPPHLFRVDELRIDKKARQSSGLRCYLVLSRTLIP